ncbi:flagellar hook assembly protein FlgD [Microvirga arsenatis]|uniref:Basal-body rod modification protein FlgD n=1 Tax=Microvirga arsenatis TaxID=2692265 RepID=A0ABW9Z0R4_9HYPH|nr:flagellar hook assembly protein FlgD [Microvirga arsenatis]NBJ11027.1 flagellar hook assembly protein FlgD [Microvirga arsenatis]NBJ25300.1 flagellar hook assembly protein FlgD [Microvirga arsenatis]
MNVTSISGAAATQRANAASSPSTATYENFLKLLMAQMKNQDPTEPMKSTEYMAQLATFSQVEQTVKSNAKLDALLASSSLLQADSVIGRTVTSADGKVSGQVSSVMITSEGALAKLSNGSEILLGPGIVVS